jgi:phage shock protein PspC (stress-responsive transcriptional regulator)/predicted membrane protein
MTETTETIGSPGTESRRLSRAHDGRWLGGVCSGLGRYFGVNPMVYRIGFVALSLAGGTGILLYVAAWLVMPDDGLEDSIAAEAIKNHRDRPWLLIGVGLLGFAALLALPSAHIWPSAGNLWVAAALAGAAIVWWHTAGRRGRPAARAAEPGEPGEPAVALPQRRSIGPVAAAALIAGIGLVALVEVATGVTIDWRIVLAVAAVVLGGLIAAGAATGHRVGSVVLLGLAVLGVLAVALAVRVPIFAGIGDRVAHPVAFASVDTRYEQGIGNLELDLQDVQFPVGETHVKATLGIGDLVVHVPDNVTVQVDARASAGEVSLFGTTHNGRVVHERTVQSGTDPSRVLVLDTRVGLGQIEVRRG